MDDLERIDAGVDRAEAEGRVIDDGTARTIAAQWHDSRWPDGLAFSTTGAISSPLEVWDGLFLQGTGALSHPQAERHATALYGYLAEHGSRGPVPGWSQVWAADGAGGGPVTG